MATATRKTNPLDDEDNRDLLIMLLDQAAKRFRNGARSAAADAWSSTAEVEGLTECAETSEMLSDYFVNWDAENA